MRLKIKKYTQTIFSLFFFLTACSPAAVTAVNIESQPQSLPATSTIPPLTFTSAPPTETFTPTHTETPAATSSATAIPTVDSLRATVTADLLSCRYGPGSEYLYLFALKKSAVIELIGRTDGNSWLLINNEPQRCWVHSKFLDISGDQQLLKIMYPAEDGYKLPVSPYYVRTTILNAVRKEGDKITVDWIHIPVSPGDYEDADMFQYIIEVWRCEDGQILFEPLVSNYPLITFVDEAGCTSASHGRVYVQDKHGYAGPAEIPWPEK